MSPHDQLMTLVSEDLYREVLMRANDLPLEDQAPVLAMVASRILAGLGLVIHMQSGSVAGLMDDVVNDAVRLFEKQKEALLDGRQSK